MGEEKVVCGRIGNKECQTCSLAMGEEKVVCGRIGNKSAKLAVWQHIPRENWWAAEIGNKECQTCSLARLISAGVQMAMPNCKFGTPGNLVAYF